MADSQRKTANLAPTSEFTNNIVDTRAFLRITVRLYNGSIIIGDNAYNVTETGTFSCSSVLTTTTPITRVYIKHDGASRDIPILDVNVDYPKGQFQFTADFQSINPQTVGGIKLKNIMLNYGSTPLPYEPYGWQHSLRKLTTATEAVENPLYSDGTAITAYTLKGNTVQNGTPTPSNPVEVNGVGVRTENLWDEEYLNIGTTIKYQPIYVGDGTFTLSTSMPTHTVEGSAGYFTNLFFLSGNVSTGASTGGNGVWYNHSITQNAIDGYVTIAYRIEVNNPSDYETMLNIGSTAKPYEPYGYKIPISSGGVTTNIDLGSTQTVRQIKKIVFDGSEDYDVSGEGTDNAFFYTDFIEACNDATSLMSTHFQVATIYSSTTTIGIRMSELTGEFRRLRIRPNNVSTMSTQDFKTWLSDQYAAGTPVTVWYVLATPKTAAVNEPLMKIGDYADTLSNAAQIPTTEGANSITVDTSVQPSEFTATWTGWHDASVKEWDGTQWS